MRQTVVVIGANGQLGTDMCAALSKDPSTKLVRLTRKEIDVCDHEKTRKTLTDLRPDTVINTAAFHRVDDCEADPGTAFQMNAFAVLNLSLVCRDIGAELVHFSTDYVFGGDEKRRRPYTEDDAPSPVSTYGLSKMAGEFFVQKICPKHFVIRTSGLFGTAGSSGKGGNFVETMIRLARDGKPIRVVDNQTTSPTFAEDLAAKTVQLIRTKKYGLYHITNGGECSWHDFAREIFKQSKLSPDLQATTTEKFGARARRPAYSAMARRRLGSMKLDDMRDWRKALGDYLAKKSRERQ